ncbi:MAG: hypothetical protein IPJ75_13235 [Ignavibacteriales bacterium]|nr:hypothetical protein [Ignavibacteriales bacterium]
MLVSPIILAVALSGIWAAAFTHLRKQFLAPVVIWATAFVILIINPHSKAEYLGAAYPALLAAGAVFLENRMILNPWVLYPVKFVIPSLIFLVGLVAMPAVIPVLKVDETIQYLQDSGFSPHQMKVID